MAGLWLYVHNIRAEKHVTFVKNLLETYYTFKGRRCVALPEISILRISSLCTSSNFPLKTISF